MKMHPLELQVRVDWDSPANENKVITLSYGNGSLLVPSYRFVPGEPPHEVVKHLRALATAIESATADHLPADTKANRLRDITSVTISGPLPPMRGPLVGDLCPGPEIAAPTPQQTKAAWAFVASTLAFCRTQMRDGFDQRVIDGAHVIALSHASRG